MKKILSLLLSILLLLSVLPAANAAETPYCIDLSQLIRNPERRHFAESMINYYLRYDSAVQETLEEGCSAVFFFEGCSDNMDDEELSDISYYRVSAVCIALKLQENGEPGITYFNANCSTLPDRPLEYGKWYLEDVGAVGPATVRDGTYELYSVKHNGAYEALHIQTSASEEKVAAVYMNEDGYVTSMASAINIHTRTGNHVIQRAMWSAGCLLVGDGDFGAFTELVQSTYYSVYDTFEKDLRVGTVTINRQYLKEELYELYGSKDAVDMLLAESRRILPEKYLQRCGDAESFEEPVTMQAAKDLELMTLPCSNPTDARSVPAADVAEGEKLNLVGSICNTEGNLWYEVDWNGQRCYVYSGYVTEVTEEPEEAETKGWFGRLIDWIF